MSLSNVAGVSAQPAQSPSPLPTLSAVSTNLAVGDTLEAFVTEALDARRVLLQMKGSTLVADTETVFRAGDRLVVRVEEVEPKILLRVLSAEISDAEKLGGYLRLQRSDPQSLAQMFGLLPEAFQSEDDPILRQPAIQRLVADILRLIGRLVYGQEALKNPLFVKHYVGQLGLLLEAGLLRALRGGEGGEKGRGSAKPAETLKGLLLQLSEHFHAQLATGTADAQDSGKLARLLSCLEASIKSIETQQVINAVAGQTDDAYFIQIPFQAPDGIRMQDVYIQGNRDAEEGRNGENRRRLVFLFNLDAVGEMMVDVALAGKTLECRIRCSDEGVRTFIASRIGGLEKGLAEAGYDVQTLSVVAKPSLAEDRMEFLSSLSLYHRNSVNLFA